MREYYDLWEPFRASLRARGRLVQGTRRSIQQFLDRRLLNRCTLFAQSGTIRDRLERWGGHEAEVLYPPPPHRPYRCDAYDGTVLSAARLQPLKRIDLLIDAAARTPGLRLRIAGEGPEEPRLRGMVESLGLRDRVEMLGHLTDDQLAYQYANCSAVYYGARAEDYGLVTLEAFSSGKPVITCTDSGGPAELVQDGETGFVVEPVADAVAGALERIALSGEAERMGGAAREVAKRHTWAATVERLLSAG
jgi:glycosyltransferase involved in cell wall biosynthesis